MNRTNVEEIILEPMQRIFSVPRDLPEQKTGGVLAEYVDALGGYDREDLHKAWREVRDAATTRSWPPIGAFVKAAALARATRLRANIDLGHGPRHRFDYDGWRKYFRALWEHVKHTELARRAAADGWALMLKTAILDGIPVAEIEPAAMAARVRRSEGLEGVVDANPDFPSRADAQGLWRGVLVRRAQAEREIALAGTDGPPAPPAPPFAYPHRCTLLNEPPEHQIARFALDQPTKLTSVDKQGPFL